ncbi:MAG TPA: ABC transporter ATP-binding protein [Desulfotomaculum sp.]|nr:ABC transporter ATP-binding protein [Desulfotomaculum sp.]
MLEVFQVNKSFHKQQVLKGVTFKIGTEIRVIIGLNGSGKSTLLKIISGIIKADEGQIFLSGKNITDHPPENREIGYVPQHPALFKHLTVWDNITYSLKNKRGSLEIGNQVVEMLGLMDVLSKKPGELSGGFKSRVSLARALTSNPRTILLDEPLSDIDAATKEKLLPEFRKALKAMNIPVIYVTHDVKEAELIGDTFSVIIGGRLFDIDSSAKAFDAIKESLSIA